MQSKQSIIVAADTIVHCNNTILQKPRNRSEASTMLQTLSGIVHQVYTAICVLEKQGPAKPHCIVKSAVADVEMAIIRPEELAAYLATGEWQGVAGAYRIQGLGACFVQRINGENSTVQGLPIHLFYDILRQRKLSSDAFTE